MINGGSDGTGIDRQEAGVLRGPSCRQPIERALGVEFLVTDHAADANDEIVEPFRRGPEVADADRAIVEIGVEHGREHPALGRAPRVTQGQIDFQKVVITFQDGAVRCNEEPANQVLKAVDLRRHARGADHANQWPSGEAL